MLIIPAVTYYGASNGKVYFNISPISLVKTSNSPKFVFPIIRLYRSFPLFMKRKEVYIKIERWVAAHFKNLSWNFSFIPENLLPVIETKQTHKEAEDYLNKMLDE